MINLQNLYTLLSEDTLSLGTVGIIHGSAGVGKTTTMLSFLHAATPKLGAGKFISFEEGVSSIQKTQNRISADTVGVASLRTEKELFELLNDSTENVFVIDSINMVSLSESKRLSNLWDRIVSFARDSNKHILVVNQRTVAQTPKGGTHGTHIVDYEIALDRSVIDGSNIIFKVVKNRLGERKNHLLEIHSKGITILKKITYDDKDLKRSYQECLKKLKKFFTTNFSSYRIQKLCRVSNESPDMCRAVLNQMINDGMVMEHRNKFQTTQERTLLESVYGIYKTLKKF